MTREQYGIILPIGALALVAVGFLFGIVVPNLSEGYYLLVALGGGAVVVAVDRLARRHVDEPFTDERIQGLAERSSLLAQRIFLLLALPLGFVLLYAFPSIEGLKLIGIGVLCTVALHSLVFGITFGVLRRTR